jgi:hypothetical protein
MSNANQKPAIEFLTTEELIDELSSRSQSIVVGLIPKNKPDAYMIRVRGSLCEAIGITSRANRIINRRLDETEADA